MNATITTTTLPNGLTIGCESYTADGVVRTVERDLESVYGAETWQLVSVYSGEQMYYVYVRLYNYQLSSRYPHKVMIEKYRPETGKVKLACVPEGKVLDHIAACEKFARL